jgi:hypothetical protein
MRINVSAFGVILFFFNLHFNFISGNTNITTDNLDQSSVITNNLNLCNKHGIFNNTTNECKCVQGFVTFPKDSKIQCNYELRSYNIARYISFFGGIFGADMFYLGYFMKGLFKCFFPIGTLFLILKIQDHKIIENFVYSYYLINGPFILMFILWVLDLILILTGVMTDANGFPLI